MAAQSEQQQGVQDSSSRGGAGGSRSGDSAGVPDGWGDVSGLSDALGMGEAVEGGYYAYRSIDDASGQPGGGSGSVDPTNSLSFRRRSARGSRGATDPSPYTRQRGAEGSAAAAAAPPPAAGSGGSASAAADVPRAAAAAAPGGDLSANAGGAGGMSGAVGGAGGYGGGASEFGEGMDQARAQASSSGAPQVRSAGGSGGQQGAGRVGNKAVDEGLPEGRLAAGGEDAQAAVGVGRDESAGSATSDSTADRVAQVYGLGADASAGAEEASVYKKEAGQEEQQDEGARKAFEGA
ncbi:hypothetical protein COO60DRAFT_1184880 [Scenedesmus sp. NREL 46B-D3]|nr:hypothetical protein COO60DRAFT_1184880 [Scenedesmus sp. NREL 46B-D3]